MTKKQLIGAVLVVASAGIVSYLYNLYLKEDTELNSIFTTK